MIPETIESQYAKINSGWLQYQMVIEVCRLVWYRQNFDLGDVRFTPTPMATAMN